MARLPRIVIPGQALHLIQRGNNRQATFYADEDYRFYLECLQDASTHHGCAIHAYVLMTNHVHLLLTPRAERAASLFMQSVGRRYVRYVNHVYQRSGTLWEGRFKSALIDSERYLLSCSRYIELNPVRAGMVDVPGGYHWSSYRCNALGQVDVLIEPHPLYQALGSHTELRAEAYRDLFSQHVNDDDLAAIRATTENGTVLGNDRFRADIEEILKRRVARLSHGGDRKSHAFLDDRYDARVEYT